MPDNKKNVIFAFNNPAGTNRCGVYGYVCMLRLLRVTRLISNTINQFDYETSQVIIYPGHSPAVGSRRKRPAPFGKPQDNRRENR